MKVLIPVHAREGHGWIGGSNYFVSLVDALRLHEIPAGSSVTVLCNRPELFAGHEAEGLDIQHAPWLDPMTRPDHFLNSAVNLALYYNHRLFRLAREMRADLITHSTPGRFSPCPTLHWAPDFQHRHLPWMFSRYERMRRDRNVRLAARSGHLLLSSHSAEADFRRFFPQFPRTRTHVLHFTPLTDTQRQQGREVLARRGIDEGYFFLPNQFWRHKNHIVVVEALRQLPEDFRVVCTGAIVDSRGNEHIRDLLARIDRYGLRDRFRMLGVIPRADMLALMAHARCVINPSRFEGWSTVVEEAKQLGKRMVLSDIPVHREQDPADSRYFPPDDPAALAAAMREMLGADVGGGDLQRAARMRGNFVATRHGFAARYWEIANTIVQG